MTKIKIKYKISPNASAHEIFDALVVGRGLVETPQPTLSYILQESTLSKDSLTLAQQLLDKHLSLGHDICIFGDYDADGVTATAIMWQSVIVRAKQTNSSSRILPFIPDRHRHGYGLGDLAVSEVISGVAFHSSNYTDFVPKLIITVDTGIVAHEGIAKFSDNNIQVIITDHHQPDQSLPPAAVIVHTTATSGAGIAWIFALHLLGASAHNLLDLATIGIVADMMPALALNRSLIKAGLLQLNTTGRPGLLALKSAMGISDKTLTTYDISFGIAPRINAAGRIYSPLDALRLLCTSDKTQAIELANKIESHNKDRQAYTDQALTHAITQPNKHNIIVIIGDYHEGVIGLVAGKLVEMYAKPAVVMSNNGDVIKGSARSIPGVNITGILRSLKTPFVGLGGHDQAAGFSIAHSQVQSLQNELETLCDQTIKPEQLIKRESADLSLELSQATLELAKLIPALEPFGLGNHKPKFHFSNLQVLEDRELGSSGKHHKLIVQKDGITREVLIFNTPHSHPIKYLQNLICTLDVNVWKERESLQLISTYVEI